MRNRIFIFKILFVDKRDFEFGKKRFIGKKAKNVTYLRILRSRNLRISLMREVRYPPQPLFQTISFITFHETNFHRQFRIFPRGFPQVSQRVREFHHFFEVKTSRFAQFRQSFSPYLTMLRHLAKLCTINLNNRCN